MNHYQRLSISFDLKTYSVIGKTWIPKENEPEDDLDFILNKKFQGIQFKAINKKMCHDFIPQQTIYLNIDQGISIEYNRYKKYVESISWESPSRLKEYLHELETCKKNDYKMTKIIDENGVVAHEN